jgi:hypothetical protein
LSFFGSNFITRLLSALLVGLEGTLLAFATETLGPESCADSREGFMLGGEEM